MVQYIARMALGMGAAFFLLALVAVLFMNPAPTERGIYYVVLGINAVVILAALGMQIFMRKSDEKFSAARKKAEKDGGRGPTIDDWLKKHSK